MKIAQNQNIAPVHAGSTQSMHTFDGHRLRLRREASYNVTTQRELSKFNVPLERRIEALELPWLEELFHSAIIPGSVINPHSLTADAQVILQEIDKEQNPRQPIFSETELFETIYQLLHTLRLLTGTTNNGRKKISRKKIWGQLLILVRAWEATLRR